MAPRRGRPPIIPTVVPPRHEESDQDNPVSALYPPLLDTVQCVLCEDMVPDVAAHLKSIHPLVHIDEYREQYPTAPLVGQASDDPVLEAARVIKVSSKEAESHPGGREGALIEKTLDQRERTGFRADVQALVESGHKAGYQVAAVAYWQTLARRTRLMVEHVRMQSKGALYHGEQVETLADLEEKISKGIAALEKIRVQRTKEAGDDPLGVVEKELDEAEAFVRGRIGEHQSRCPSCTQPLLVPELPHWAFTASKDERGELYWPVWSPELWLLYRAGVIALWMVAYTLRTSPEGLRYTAQRRDEEWPKVDIDLEEALLREQLLADDRVVRQTLLPVLPETQRQKENHAS
jgi:hypothetical protein